MIKIKFHKKAAKITALSKNCYLDIQIKYFFIFIKIYGNVKIRKDPVLFFIASQSN